MRIDSGKIYYRWDQTKGNKRMVNGVEMRSGLPVIVKRVGKKEKAEIENGLVYEVRAEDFKSMWPEIKFKKGWTHDIASNKHW